MSDFILFWMAKAVAEIAFGLIVVVLFVAVLAVIQYRQDRRAKKQKGAKT